MRMLVKVLIAVVVVLALAAAGGRHYLRRSLPQNARTITASGASLPPEFTLLRFEPEPFTGPDVLAWVKMMAWDLSGNYAFELLRHDLANAVGAERLAQLMPPYAPDGLSITEWPGGPGGPGES